MPALDTNVLVRYIVQDDAAQLAAGKRLISRCVAEGTMLLVPVTGRRAAAVDLRQGRGRGQWRPTAGQGMRTLSFTGWCSRSAFVQPQFNGNQEGPAPPRSRHQPELPPQR